MNRKNSKKRYKLIKGVIENQDGIVIGTIREDAPQEDIDTILNSGAVLEKVEDFVEGVETGSLKPKKAYNEFKSVLNE